MPEHDLMKTFPAEGDTMQATPEAGAETPMGEETPMSEGEGDSH